MSDPESGAPQSLNGTLATRPSWHRPEVTVLDVERGTVATSGSVSDGHSGSTS